MCTNSYAIVIGMYSGGGLCINTFGGYIMFKILFCFSNRDNS